MSLIEKKDGAASREAERDVGERSGADGGRPAPEAVPDPELAERPKRRRFSAEYKLGVLKQANAFRKPGELGALYDALAALKEQEQTALAELAAVPATGAVDSAPSPFAATMGPCPVPRRSSPP